MRTTELDYWFIPSIASLIDVLISLVASGHVVLTKRDTRSAIGWIGLIWLSPFLGTGLYVLLGINRIHRKARSLRKRRRRVGKPHAVLSPGEELRRALQPDVTHLAALETLVFRATGRSLLPGNRIEPLRGGNETFPAMIRAIEEATRSVTLVTYIFDKDRAGLPVVEALGRAVDRGVEVRVLIDAYGSRHAWSTVLGPLREVGVRVELFNPTLVPGWFRFVNLRNHRKIMVVDGRVGFTGGMNIYEDYDPRLEPRYPKCDLHFRVEGPAVADMQQVFADDWAFTTDELLDGETFFPALGAVGTVLARGVPDGPDDGDDKLTLAILGALATARDRVEIVTPYFLPDVPIISALNVASLRGVEVDVILPSENNHPIVKWASMPYLRQVVEHGCRVWLSPPPFDHAKLMVVDKTWTFLGSANWDARSLRLNFEYNMECYDRDFVATLEPFLSHKREHAAPLTLEQIDARSLPIRLRDGVARLFSPYL